MYNLTPSQYLIPPLFFSGVALSLVTSAERFNPGARRVPVKLFLDSSFYVGEIRVSVSSGATGNRRRMAHTDV